MNDLFLLELITRKKAKFVLLIFALAFCANQRRKANDGKFSILNFGLNSDFFHKLAPSFRIFFSGVRMKFEIFLRYLKK
jgi:hypothetical protein